MPRVCGLSECSATPLPTWNQPVLRCRSLLQEWGRQFFAGQNPLVIAAVSKLPDGTAIKEADVEGAA